MNASSVHTRRLSDLTALFLTVCMYANAEGADGKISQNWVDLYEPHIYNEMPYRLMTPLHFDSNKRFPVIVSLHGGGGRGTDPPALLAFLLRAAARVRTDPSREIRGT